MSLEGAKQTRALLLVNYHGSIESASEEESVSVTRSGAGCVTVKHIGDLPPNHVDQVTPPGYTVGPPAIQTTGGSVYLSYMVYPKKARIQWVLMKLALLAAAAVFVASLVYLYVHWGSPVDRAVRDYAKMSGVSHETLTYSAAAVVLLFACSVSYWVICSGRDKPHEKSH